LGWPTYDLVGREKARGAALEREKVEIDEGFRVTGERLQSEERCGVHDQRVTGRLVWTENVLVPGSKKELVGEEFEFVVEDRLAGDEFFVHATSLSRTANEFNWRGS
jgi:hypothetical protein